MFIVVTAIIAVFGTCRALVVVANSAGLAEEVDETRVSRGVATSAFSATTDVSSIIGPLVAGFVASGFGVHAMFPIMGAGVFLLFVLSDFAVRRWQRSAATPAREPTSPLGVSLSKQESAG
jgi:MFS family permease